MPDTRAAGSAAAWHPRPADWQLSRDTVHVWRAGLDRLAPRLPRLSAVLASDELRRAERFHSTRHRDRFVVARAVLRHLLGRYLACEPAQVGIAEDPGGKPQIAGASAVRFNVSHSEDVLVCAFTLGRNVGIDVERIRAAVAADAVAEMFFSPREAAALRALPPSRQPAAFFETWTRKEAYAKATGRGLTAGVPDVRSRDSGRWLVRTLEVAPGYAAALVVEGAHCELRLYDGDEACATSSDSARYRAS